MGCGASKDKDSNPNEIKSTMKVTKIGDFDDFFNSASDLLGGLEELRSGFQDTREEMNEIARTDELAHPSLIEAIKVFLWSVSAHKEGKILAANMRFTTDPPALTVDCSYMDHITYDFSQAFMDMIKGMTGAPAKLIEIGQKAKEIGEKSVDLAKDIPGKVKGSGLNPFEQVKASANAAMNFKTVTAGLAKVPNVVKETQEALKDIAALLPKIVELIAQADDVGKKAHDKGIRKMGEMFDHFQTAPKKTPEQIAAEKKGKKPKKIKRKGKKAGDAKEGAHKEAGHATAGKAHA
jgi:hypothetical protein